MSAETTAMSEAAIRPLLMATVASGVLALGLLQFLGSALPALEFEGRMMVSHGVRAAFFAFLGCAATLLVAMLASVWRSPRLCFAFNLYGALTFVVGSFLAGGMIGGALGTLSQEPRRLPEGIAFFFVFNVSMVGLLALAGLVGRVRTARPVAVLTDPTE